VEIFDGFVVFLFFTYLHSQCSRQIHIVVLANLYVFLQFGDSFSAIYSKSVSQISQSLGRVGLNDFRLKFFKFPG